MTQLQHSQTGAWHQPDCPALTRQEAVACGCPEFDFYDVAWTIEAGAGEGYYFRWHGTEYVVECWATRNAGGEDIYEVDSGAAVVPWEDEYDADDEYLGDSISERFQAELERVKTIWGEAWAKHVVPAIETAKKEALEAIAERPCCSADDPQTGRDHDETCENYDGAPCCADSGCGGNPCTFPGYADNH